MKYGTNQRAALSEARRLGASLTQRPGTAWLQVAFPGHKPIRVSLTDRTAPTHLISMINAASRPADPTHATPRQKRPKTQCRDSHVLTGVNPPRAERRPQSFFDHRPCTSKPWYRTTSIVDHTVGEILLARLYREGQPCVSPIIIIEADASLHSVVGLTPVGTYRSGIPRHRLPNFLACGFESPMYLYAPRRLTCAAADVLAHIGWADSSLWQLIHQIGI